MARPRRTKARWVLSALVLLPCLAGPARGQDDWTLVTEEDGVEVSQRPVPGRSLPVLRGIGVVEANLFEVLAVIRDVERLNEWVHTCIESRLLGIEGDAVAYAYTRSDAPWPVSDRDVVVRSETLVLEAGAEVHIRFRSVEHDSQGEVDGVVRMPRLRGHYRLRVTEAGRTRVEYQVDADPGGRLPTWLVRRTARDIPLRTIVNLRKQVARTRGEYADFVRRSELQSP